MATMTTTNSDVADHRARGPRRPPHRMGRPRDAGGAPIRERFGREQPLAGLRVGACLHVTSETANLAITLKAGGADGRLCASNPLSTNDAVAAALTARHGIPTFAVRGEDSARYFSHITSVLDGRPNLTMDDGADLVAELHRNRPELLEDVRAGTEETTTGVIRLRAMAADGSAAVPDHRRERSADQAHVRQSLRHRPVDARRSHPGDEHPARGTHHGVCGYGWCGRGWPAGPTARRQRHRHRGRPDARAGGGDGRLPRDAARDAAPTATSSSPSPATSTSSTGALRAIQGRRHHRQQRSFQRRDQPGGAG